MKTLAGPRIPTLTIIPAAITANVAAVRVHTRSAIMAVVKADGYGHGATTVARSAVAAGATWLGVTQISEAIRLRTEGFTVPILSWLNSGEIDSSAAAHWQIDIAIGSISELRELLTNLNAATGKVRIHLHVDTGMARGGCPRSAWPELVALAASAQCLGLITVIGLMGHLPLADAADPELNTPAVNSFTLAHKILVRAGLGPVITHLAATSGTLTDSNTHADLVRVGAALVGIDPSGSSVLHAASYLRAPIIHSVEVPPRTPVGYGSTFHTSTRTHLATIGIGYADGIPRRLDSAAAVELGGSRFPIVGRVSMDQIVVDTGHRYFERGTLATIFGPSPTGIAPTIHEWAHWAGTIPHEIITGIGPRIARNIA